MKSIAYILVIDKLGIVKEFTDFSFVLEAVKKLFGDSERDSVLEWDLTSCYDSTFHDYADFYIHKILI